MARDDKIPAVKKYMFFATYLKKFSLEWYAV
jgi:hypothetical protein